MKIKNILIEQQEREAQASPLPLRDDFDTSNLNNKNVSNIAEATNFLDSATFYSNYNIKVIPVRKQDKKPLTIHGWKDASADEVVLQEWNKQFPECNIGIPTGALNNIFVVDVDGESGAQSLAALENAYGKLNAPTVNTGKGKHLYFKMPEKIDIKCSTSKIAPHIDIRGNGGYVVAPPSVHKNGNKYTWVNFDINQGFPKAPEWLINLITNPEETNIDVLLEEIAIAPEGTRNDTLISDTVKICNSANNQFRDISEVKEDIINAALESGLSEAEAIRTVNNGIKFSEANSVKFADTDPDMDILKTKDLLPAPRLDTSIFKGLEPWVIQTAENTNAPVDYVAFALLAGAAGIVGLSRTISTQTDWVQHCCLWIGIVGDPSSGKSPAMKPIRDILNQIETEREPYYMKAYRKWEGAAAIAEQKEKNWRKKIKKLQIEESERPEDSYAPEMPSTYHLLYGDTTQESITKELCNNVKGALVLRDELSGWIDGMNKYSSGRSERSFWLETFSGGKYIVNRVKFGTDREEVEDLMATVFGSIQPQKLEKTVNNDSGDGFLSRFLWVYPAPIPPVIPLKKPESTAVYQAFKKLDNLLLPYDGDVEKQRKCLYLSDSAQVYFNNWLLPHMYKIYNEEDRKLKDFLGKGQGYVLRFALLFELLWWANSESVEPREVSTEAIKVAINLYDNYLTPMCERVYYIYDNSECYIEARALARWILENKPENFILRDVYNNGTVKYLRRKEPTETAAKRLVELNWLRYECKRAGTTKGKRRITYYVNPEVYALAENY